MLNALPLDELAPVCRVVEAVRGETIWSHGAQVDFFGAVDLGFVKMVRSSSEGQTVTAELMGPGQAFGMSGTVVGTGCPLSAIAVTTLRYARIPKAAFLEHYRESVATKESLLMRTVTRLHATTGLMARLASGSVERRIAAILETLAESYGRRENGLLRLTVPLTRQEIADMAGTTVESAIRVFSRWQKEGLVATDRRSIILLRPETLAAL